MHSRMLNNYVHIAFFFAPLKSGHWQKKNKEMNRLEDCFANAAEYSVDRNKRTDLLFHKQLRIVRFEIASFCMNLLNNIVAGRLQHFDRKQLKLPNQALNTGQA